MPGIKTQCELCGSTTTTHYQVVSKQGVTVKDLCCFCIARLFPGGVHNAHCVTCVMAGEAVRSKELEPLSDHEWFVDLGKKKSNLSAKI